MNEELRFHYRIYSIKRRPRLNAADGGKISNKRRTQLEECSVYSRIIRKKTSTVQLGNVQLRFHLSKKARHWNFKHVSVLHNIYK